MSSQVPLLSRASIHCFTHFLQEELAWLQVWAKDDLEKSANGRSSAHATHVRVSESELTVRRLSEGLKEVVADVGTDNCAKARVRKGLLMLESPEPFEGSNWARVGFCKYPSFELKPLQGRCGREIAR
jgi:hypothetical protein